VAQQSDIFNVAQRRFRDTKIKSVALSLGMLNALQPFIDSVEALINSIEAIVDVLEFIEHQPAETLQILFDGHTP
jgi:hypothetical protein